MSNVRLLTSEDVRAVVAETEEYIAAVRDGYRQRGNGAPAKPRQSLASSELGGTLTGYRAILPETGTMGGYTYSAGFRSRDAWFVTPLFDARSGELLALIDGASMNPLKTGAVGAVGTDVLAREDASTVGVFGSGAQAYGQLVATATVRDLQEVRVYSPTKDHRRQFAGEVDARLSADVAAVDTSAEAVDGADIVITATRATEPVFDGALLEAGTHVTAMGQYHPKKREVDSTTVARARYVPDLRDRLKSDAGAYIQAAADGAIEANHDVAELGDVVAGNATGRGSPDDITVFDSGGTGIETVATATRLYEQAVSADRGVVVDFQPASEATAGRFPESVFK